MNFVDSFNKLIAPFRVKLSNMILRGIVTGTKSDKKLQQVQIKGLADETLDKLEHLESYGFTSNPDDGAEALVLFVGGNRDHGVVVSTPDRRVRLKGLAKGDVAIYHKDGTKIVLKGSGKIQIMNPAGNELFSVLSETLQHLIDAKTMDPLSGPEPLFPGSIADFTADKAKIDSFKVLNDGDE